MSETEREAIAGFERDIITPSMTGLVVLQFTATWCGPCKQLSPILDKVAADYADRGVILKRIDVDEDKVIAAQFRIQSVPTVYAMFQGQPVADLTQFRTEAAIAKALDQLLSQLPVKSEAKDLKAEVEPLIAMDEQVLAEGDATRAAGIFAQIHDMDPANPDVIGGLVRAVIAEGKPDEARILLDAIDQQSTTHPAIARARAALEVASAPVADVSEEQARIAANPDDHEARFAIAKAMMASGDRDGAAEELLSIIGREPAWNEGAAKAQLLQMLEAAGYADPWGRGIRRRLSALLFT